MRVTFVLPFFSRRPIGGFRIVYQHANGLARRGHDVTVVHAGKADGGLPSRALPLEVAKALIRVERAAMVKRVQWEPIDPYVRILCLLGRPSEKNLPDGDVIFATSWPTAEYVARLSGRKGVGCYLIQGHEVWSGPADRVNATWRLPLRKAAVSRWLCELGTELGCATPTLIPNAIDHDRFRPLNRLSSRPLRFLSMSHADPNKGTKDALEALVLLKRKFPSIGVSMFGVSRRPTFMPDWVEYHRRPSARFLIEELYNKSAIYVAASHSEGWGLPLAEAMACGCALVATDIGGFSDYATHEKTALLSPVGDPVALFKNLARVVESQPLLRRLQQAGAAKVREFTWERSGLRMEAFIADVISTASTDSARAQAPSTTLACATQRCCALDLDRNSPAWPERSWWVDRLGERKKSRDDRVASIEPVREHGQDGS